MKKKRSDASFSRKQGEKRKNEHRPGEKRGRERSVRFDFLFLLLPQPEKEGKEELKVSPDQGPWGRKREEGAPIHAFSINTPVVVTKEERTPPQKK